MSVTTAKGAKTNQYLASIGHEIIQMVYDFSVDGGLVSTINLAPIPQDMIVHAACMKVSSGCTSGGSATISLGATSSAADIIAATAVASFSAGALISGITPVKVAAGDQIVLGIAVAALTAGKMVIELEVSKF